MGYAHATEFTYGLGDIIRRLGQSDGPRGERGTPWQIRYLGGLIADYGFPAPLPVLVGDAVVDVIKPASRWPQPAVDRWFEDRMPPEAAAAVDLAAMRAGAEAMDARAQAIGLRIVHGERA